MSTICCVLYLMDLFSFHLYICCLSFRQKSFQQATFGGTLVEFLHLQTYRSKPQLSHPQPLLVRTLPLNGLFRGQRSTIFASVSLLPKQFCITFG